MAFLRAQIKPHFLFNALSCIISLCSINANDASTQLINLSSVLRHGFNYDENNNYVSFEEELSYVKAYVGLEEVRFDYQFRMIYEIDFIQDFIIPPLTLQPLVENAITHGLKCKDGNGFVVLRVKDQTDSVFIEIEDNGAGMTIDKIHFLLSDIPKSGVGINNINRRLKMMYGKGLTVKSTLGKGTSVSFLIPKTTCLSNYDYSLFTN